MKKQMIGKANMAYLDVGEGHPIVMGHSYLWDAEMWRPQIDVFQKNYRCIVPDLWSHGQSDPLSLSEYSIEQLAEDYWQFTQALGLKKFTLMGLSVGGMWAAHLALSHPEAVSGLVLMDTYVGAEPEITQQTYLEMMDEIEKDKCFTLEFSNKVAPYFFAKNTNTEQPQLVSNFIKSLMDVPANHIPGKVALGRAIFTRNSLIEKVAQIKVPTLIVVGEEDIPRPPYESQEMAKSISNSEIEIVPHAGHICTLEQPDYVNQLLARFMRSRE